MHAPYQMRTGSEQYPFSSAPRFAHSYNRLLRRGSEFASAIAYETKVQRMVQLCGIRMTALYLRNRGYTAEQAVTLMFR